MFVEESEFHRFSRGLQASAARYHEDGLATDDDEGRFAREIRNGADGVLELLAGHRGSGVSARSRAVTSGGGGAGGDQSGGAPGGG